MNPVDSKKTTRADGLADDGEKVGGDPDALRDLIALRDSEGVEDVSLLEKDSEPIPLRDPFADWKE
ncbi:hypothetical protein [uncultured Pseudacidovorax sp.]|uniref:hypothetical protein n=1 Tax=uncultured Pseudacidovorax sp. TaxID=679313 RepID=UPI0025CD65DA|nr:hypothetical protein [uncultured Pseudacidovorax sp.]